MHFSRYLFLRIFYSGYMVVDEVVGTQANCVDYPIFYRYLFGMCGNIPCYGYITSSQG
ncbi:MAG TPA: hypothetical protein PLH52_01090 [Paludibacteraceae bacterium]|nr:hypothetical protein [Paludibacteraceae bacterium]